MINNYLKVYSFTHKQSSLGGHLRFPSRTEERIRRRKVGLLLLVLGLAWGQEEAGSEKALSFLWQRQPCSWGHGLLCGAPASCERACVALMIQVLATSRGLQPGDGECS